MSGNLQKTRRQRSKGTHIDYVLLNVVLFLVGIGLVFIFSSSAHMAQIKMGDATYFVKKQILWSIIGIIFMIIGINLKFEVIKRFLRSSMIFVTILLITTHIPIFAASVKGATRWINIGGISIQPSEFAKLVLIIFTATILSNPKYKNLNIAEKFITLIPIVGMVLLVLLQPDLGTTLVISASIFCVYFVAGLPYWKTFLIIISGCTGVLMMALSIPYQKARLFSFFNPWEDPQGTGFHLTQSMMAIGSGGIFGKGLGQSIQKLFYLPEQHTDFIFAIIAEEIGLIGVTTILILFSILAYRGFSIAKITNDPFNKLLAAGITSLICGQAILNIGVVTGSLPTTGITLPFISSGGSSLIITFFSIGLLLNISKKIKKKKTKIDSIDEATIKIKFPYTNYISKY